mmetsp:Transcript_46902/g.50624  ORF Transcript_46902/g.50624 Transcript_46902/m.50624 type:complete len:183 (+) Transcript_46902:347-895(+)
MERYYLQTPWTLAEAKKMACSIASRKDPVIYLDLNGDLFSNKGTFECIFNAILDGGMVEEFEAQGDTLFDLKCGCIEKSNLATNTTLKRLTLWESDISVENEEIEQLANALKTNQGLEKLFCRGLLKSLRDNISLMVMDTMKVPMLINDNDLSSNELLRLEGGIEGRELQSEINKHMKLNKF